MLEGSEDLFHYYALPEYLIDASHSFLLCWSVNWIHNLLILISYSLALFFIVGVGLLIRIRYVEQQVMFFNSNKRTTYVLFMKAK